MNLGTDAQMDGRTQIHGNLAKRGSNNVFRREYKETKQILDFVSNWSANGSFSHRNIRWPCQIFHWTAFEKVLPTLVNSKTIALTVADNAKSEIRKIAIV